MTAKWSILLCQSWWPILKLIYSQSRRNAEISENESGWENLTIIYSARGFSAWQKSYSSWLWNWPVERKRLCGSVVAKVLSNCVISLQPANHCTIVESWPSMASWLSYQCSQLSLKRDIAENTTANKPGWPSNGYWLTWQYSNTIVYTAQYSCINGESWLSAKYSQLCSLFNTILAIQQLER